MKKVINHTPLITLKRKKTPFQKILIRTSKDIFNFVKNFYYDDLDLFESFFIVMLNAGNETIGFAKIGQGGISQATVDVRLIMKFSIDSLCSSIICCHNHPSGRILPSDNDVELTSKIKNASQFFNIKFLDHLIITEENYYSFADEGKI